MLKGLLRTECRLGNGGTVLAEWIYLVAFSGIVTLLVFLITWVVG